MADFGAPLMPDLLQAAVALGAAWTRFSGSLGEIEIGFQDACVLSFLIIIDFIYLIN